MKIQKLITTLAVVVFAGSAFAETTTTTTTTRSPAYSSSRRSGGSSYDAGTNRSIASGMATARNESGFMPAVGLGFGHLDQSGNSDIDGDAVSASLIGTYYFNNNWLADAGLGVYKQYFRDVQPTAGMISLSGRYQFPGRWSIGPAADFLFGTTQDFGSANNYLTMGGIVGFKELVFANDQLLRLGLKYSTQIGIKDQTSNFFGVVAEWGIGGSNSLVRSVSMNQ